MTNTQQSRTSCETDWLHWLSNEPLTEASYETFTHAVRQYHLRIAGGWYNICCGGVLPPEREIVHIKHTGSKGQIVTGYWFMPVDCIKDKHTLAGWLARVRWKCLAGYGVDCVSWHKPAYDAGGYAVYPSLSQQA